MTIRDLLKYLSGDTIQKILEELAKVSNDDTLANSLFDRIYYLTLHDEESQ